MKAVLSNNTDIIRLLLRSYVHINMVNSSSSAVHISQFDKPMALLVKAAGQEIRGNNCEIYDCPEMTLLNLCREAIRKHLLQMSPHENLFGRVPRLGLPSIITNYLLYDQTLDEEDQRQTEDFLVWTAAHIKYIERQLSGEKVV